MKNRLVAIVLTVILVLNNGAALAHPTHSSAVPEVHTVHFGVMEGGANSCCRWNGRAPA